MGDRLRPVLRAEDAELAQYITDWSAYMSRYVPTLLADVLAEVGAIGYDWLYPPAQPHSHGRQQLQQQAASQSSQLAFHRRQQSADEESPGKRVSLSPMARAVADWSLDAQQAAAQLPGSPKEPAASQVAGGDESDQEPVYLPSPKDMTKLARKERLGGPPFDKWGRPREHALYGIRPDRYSSNGEESHEEGQESEEESETGESSEESEMEESSEESGKEDGEEGEVGEFGKYFEGTLPA